MTRSGARLRIGCSGWQYRHWRGDFYPAELPQPRWLEHYAARFDTVEINNSFYRLPSAETFSSWRARAPAGFVHAVKASRFLTHMKKLKDPDDPLTLFFSHADPLGPRLGPVLYQLPPRWQGGPVGWRASWTPDGMCTPTSTTTSAVMRRETGCGCGK